MDSNLNYEKLNSVYSKAMAAARNLISEGWRKSLVDKEDSYMSVVVQYNVLYIIFNKIPCIIFVWSPCFIQVITRKCILLNHM
jgi:hypothetical protein